MNNKWPKAFTPLTKEQQRISDDFMKYWHEVLPNRYGVIDRFNHQYPVRRAPSSFHRTLEIGAGLGEHLEYEKLSPEQEREYHAIDIRTNMVEEMKRRFPRINACVGDVQERLDFPDGHFDRILAIHVLEHLCNLPAAIREMYRLCDKQRGFFSVVIPCEGGLLYSLARRISAQRIFEKRYGQPYTWFIEREHVNRPAEIIDEIAPYFERMDQVYFPTRLPYVALNLVIGMTFRPRPESKAYQGTASVTTTGSRDAS